MIKEQRSLIFSKDDIREAVLRFRAEKKDFLPAGNLVGLDVGEGDRPGLSIRVQIADRIFEKSVDLSTEQLAGILIHYCIRSHIPIPRKARKEIRRLDDGVVLRIVIDRDERNSAAQAAARHAGAA